MKKRQRVEKEMPGPNDRWPVREKPPEPEEKFVGCWNVRMFIWKVGVRKQYVPAPRPSRVGRGRWVPGAVSLGRLIMRLHQVYTAARRHRLAQQLGQDTASTMEGLERLVRAIPTHWRKDVIRHLPQSMTTQLYLWRKYT